MKRILALLLSVLLVLSLVACGDTTDNDADSDLPADSESEKESLKDEEETSVLRNRIKLTDSFSFVARSDIDMIKKDAEFIKISDIDEQYLRKEDGYIYVSCEAPVFEVIDAGRSGSIRFATTADSIVVKGSFTDYYVSATTVDRAVFGVDVYEGSGTDRVWVNRKLQKFTGASLAETATLAGGYNEVLINLPVFSKTASFEIGFLHDYDGIALPSARDHAPVVFFGSEITQGASASRPGDAYANLASRMLNVDAINLGGYAVDEAKEYISSLGEVSAFVIELDRGFDIEELRTEHYSFYEAVREKYPDAPIVFITDPVFTEAQAEAATERVGIIAESCIRAAEAGDNKIYLLNGKDIFPMFEELADLATSDLETPNDLGHYYLALAVYDILNSAFTPDSEKHGTERLAGLGDRIDFAKRSDNSAIMEGEYIKVSDVDSAYVKSTRNGVTLLNYDLPQFELGGINDPANNDGKFYRLDINNRDAYSKEVYAWQTVDGLAYNTSGGTIRFRTNAEEIVIKSVMKHTDLYPHMSVLGESGFDVYVGTGTDKVLCGTVAANRTADRRTFEGTVALGEGYKEVTIELPLYNGPTSLMIGFTDENAEIAAPLARDYDAPIVFYAGSVTQGCAATRPGLSYPNMICRMLNADCKNLAFSGSGRGEQIMAEYIASLEMTAFVSEYDDNSSIPELRQNHYNFYKTIREAQPDLPIIILSHPVYTRVPNAEETERAAIIRETYTRAIAEGDKNVYFIEPMDFYPMLYIADIHAIDFAHPTDTGFYYMAKAVYELLDDILAK